MTAQDWARAVMASAYDPENCEQCEAVGHTCVECALDALAEVRS